MRKRNKQLAAGAMFGLLVVPVVTVGIAASAVDAAEKPTVEAIRARICEQWNKVHSLHLRVRQETTLSVELDGVSAWPSKLSLPAFLGTEDVLFALDGDKRYLRSLGLDGRAIGSPGSRSSDAPRQQRTHDRAWVWNGKTLRERTKVAGGRFKHRVLAGSEALGRLPSPQYVMNWGFGVPDPTAEREVNDRLRRMWFLPEVLRSSTYTVADATDAIDGSRCIVIERRQAGADSSSAAHGDLKDDKMWLELEHGLALQKREFKVDDRLVRIARGFRGGRSGAVAPAAQSNRGVPPLRRA